MAADDLNSEVFGLGSDFDYALAQSSGDGDGGSIGGDDKGIFMTAEDSRLANIDFFKLKMILDVPLKVSVELGRTKILVNDILQLGHGSVVEIDKIDGDPMEILINDKLVAMGEIVVMNETFGFQLTDVVSQFGLGDLGQQEG